MKRNLTATLVAIAVLVIVLSMASAGLSQGAASPHEQATPAATVQGAVIGGTNGPTPYISPSTCGQAKIYLGDAGHFVVLAGTTVTNTLMTVVHGNLGLSPGSAVTGFPPGKVTGATDIANKAAANAQLALVKAYNTGMGRTNCAVSVSGNIGGRTLGPGLYHSSSSLAISSGDLYAHRPRALGSGLRHPGDVQAHGDVRSSRHPRRGGSGEQYLLDRGELGDSRDHGRRLREHPRPQVDLAGDRGDTARPGTGAHRSGDARRQQDCCGGHLAGGPLGDGVGPYARAVHRAAHSLRGNIHQYRNETTGRDPSVEARARRRTTPYNPFERNQSVNPRTHGGSPHPFETDSTAPWINGNGPIA